ncbi:Thymidylate kinase [hydrothermal vent metagenome]|uniref:dTMP kinase n=1 Tax=hydrothermal vent metagenome TaxID=652676 RepID=A0A160VHA3_9ZZZZ
MSSSNNAKFITFEGIDGCGKSTQARLLLEYMNKSGVETILVREPGGTNISESIREILLHSSSGQMGDRTESLLMTASRAQLTQEVIIPNMDQGKFVIADRYSDSTLAYQGGGRNLDIEWLIELNNYATFTLLPDITFFVDIRSEEALRRLDSNKDRIEGEGIEFQARVRKTYHELAERFNDRYVILDGYGEIDDIHQKVLNEMIRRKFIS